MARRPCCGVSRRWCTMSVGGWDLTGVRRVRLRRGNNDSQALPNQKVPWPRISMQCSSWAPTKRASHRLDTDGVAPAAVQGPCKLVQDKYEQIARLRTEKDAQIAALTARLKVLEGRIARPSVARQAIITRKQPEQVPAGL